MLLVYCVNFSKRNEDVETGGASSFVFDRQTTPERIAEILRHKIATGSLAPGTRLVEAEYTRAFGVARHTLREAIALLVRERLLTRVTFKGVEVTRLTAADVRDIYAGRRAIEVPAVALLQWAPPSLRAVRLAIETLISRSRDVSSELMHQYDTAVHYALVAAHGSTRISQTHATLMAELNILLFKTYRDADVRLAIERHGAFDRLLEAGDFSGAQAQLDARLRASEQQMTDSLTD